MAKLIGGRACEFFFIQNTAKDTQYESYGRINNKIQFIILPPEK